MKKNLLIIATGMFITFISCNSKKTDEVKPTVDKANSNAEKNLAAVHEINKDFETGNSANLGDYIAADAVDHSDNGDVKGLDSIKAEFAKYYQQADMHSATIKEFADDNTVIAWLKYNSTMKVDAYGMKAGQKYEMDGVEVTKFKDGKATEHWQFMQMSDIMKMMGGPNQGGNK